SLCGFDGGYYSASSSGTCFLDCCCREMRHQLSFAVNIELSVYPFNVNPHGVQRYLVLMCYHLIAQPGCDAIFYLQFPRGQHIFKLPEGGSLIDRSAVNAWANDRALIKSHVDGQGQIWKARLFGEEADRILAKARA